MSVIERKPRRPGETADEFAQREKQYWAKVEKASERLQALREKHGCTQAPSSSTAP